MHTQAHIMKLTPIHTVYNTWPFSFLCALFAWFHRGSPTLKVEVVVVLRQTALALAFLHSLGIVTW